MSLDPLFAAGPIITAHAGAAMAALLLGIVQLSLPKGTGGHRILGYGWAALMLFVAGSGLWIHELRMLGPFSPIHLLSVLVLVTVPLAVLAARRGNVQRHRAAMLRLYFFALIVTGAFTLLHGRVMHAVVFGG
ncbi:MAG: DUF2306 domain-containing protein [Rhodothalassiaceae bacterium]